MQIINRANNKIAYYEMLLKIYKCSLLIVHWSFVLFLMAIVFSALRITFKLFNRKLQFFHFTSAWSENRVNGTNVYARYKTRSWCTRKLQKILQLNNKIYILLKILLPPPRGEQGLTGFTWLTEEVQQNWLTPHSTIFQLYWWRKPNSPKENHSPATSHWQLYHTMLYRVHLSWEKFEFCCQTLTNTSIHMIGTICTTIK
jgi:hypothetical protein